MIKWFNGLFLTPKDKIVFLVGCFSTFYVSLVGRVYVGELIIFFLYLFYPETCPRLPRQFNVLKKLLYLWLLSAIVTDLWRGTPYIDMLKGTISILFIRVLLPFAYWALYDRLSRWMTFFLGTVVSAQLTYYLLTVQTAFGSSEIWKVYSYAPLLTGLAMLFFWNNKKNYCYITLLVFGVWILFGGSRNIFLICSLTVTMLVVINRFIHFNTKARILRYQGKISGLFIALLFGCVAVDQIYENLAASGTLGEKAYDKYETQKNHQFGLASGRIEFIMDIQLISESPIIGYGSFAKDKNNFGTRFMIEHNIPLEKNHNPRAKKSDDDSVENMLPRHSRIGGLWMWHGIGAGIFWIYILYLIFRTFRTGSFLLEPKLIALCIFTMMSEVWDTFFSIMSTRLPFIFMVIYLILIYSKYQKLNVQLSR